MYVPWSLISRLETGRQSPTARCIKRLSRLSLRLVMDQGDYLLWCGKDMIPLCKDDISYGNCAEDG